MFYAFDSGTETNEDRLIALLLLVDLENEPLLVDNAVSSETRSKISNCINQLVEELTMSS